MTYWVNLLIWMFSHSPLIEFFQKAIGCLESRIALKHFEEFCKITNQENLGQVWCTLFGHLYCWLWGFWINHQLFSHISHDSFWSHSKHVIDIYFKTMMGPHWVFPTCQDSKGQQPTAISFFSIVWVSIKWMSVTG